MPQISVPSTSSMNGSSLNPLWFAAGAFVLFGIIRRPKVGLAMAAATGLLAYKTVKEQAQATEYDATGSVLLNTTPEQAYSLWRNCEQLPRFMSHLKSVHVLDDRRSEWTALGPLGKEVSWRAEIIEDTPNRKIAWQSLPDADVQNRGSVTFTPHPQGRGTIVAATVTYSLPLGAAAKALITLLGKNPEFLLREDLRRFKSLLEAGEAPTTVGQSHGTRGWSGKAKEALFRETSNHPEPQASQPASDAQLQIV